MKESQIVQRIVKIAKSLVTKTYPVILDKPEWNKRLWREIEDVAHNLFSMADKDEEDERSDVIAKSKARELAGKYIGYSYPGTRKDLEDMILEMIWEEYHSK